MDAEAIKARLVTTMTITDAETGESTYYKIENEDMDIYKSPDNQEITVIIYVGNDSEYLTRDASQSK